MSQGVALVCLWCTIYTVFEPFAMNGLDHEEHFGL